jgi:type I restriction enzyme S subunit
MNKNQFFKLADVTTLITDGKHGDSRDESGSGFFFLSSKDLRDGRLQYDDPREINQDDFLETHRRTNLKPGDILLTNCGASIGRVGIAQRDERIFRTTFQKSISVIKANNKLIDSKYLYFFCLTNSKHFIDLGGGTAQPNLLIGDLKRLKIQLPPLFIQKKIAAILSGYDELIENNQRRITLLEKIAEEIYREWFVRLRFPDYDKVKFVKGIPEGWRAIQFTEICEFQKGKTPDQLFLENQDGLLPYITVEFIEGKGTEYVLKSQNSIVCENGDVLMLMDGARSGLVFRGKKGIVGSTFARVAVEPLYRDIVYEFLRATREHIVSNNTGSAIPHANKEFIHRLVMFLPENEILIEKFNALYRSLFEQTLNLVSQNELLRRSRDALLPRLISGKLSVENLDIQFPPGMVEDAHA